jgi:hypothetical protein
MIALVARAAEVGPDLPADPKVIGLGVFALLVVMLLITLAFGRYR